MSSLRVGAVRYLNMLPYFFDSPDVEAFDTPAQLNDAMRAGLCDAACMSAIAGIKAGFKPIEPMMGVASNENVGSVFVEPLIETPQQHLFWSRFLTTNSAIAQKTLREKNTTLTHVAIFTAGASEQSLWLARLLLHWQGYKTSVHRVDKNISKDIRAAQISEQLPHTGASQALFLCIGDVALYRVFEQKFVSANNRWDLASLWKRACGVPCVFATWFVRPDIAQVDQNTLASKLMGSLERWQLLSHVQQLERAEGFLRQKNDPLVESLRTTSVSDAMTHYFRELDFVFSEPYRHTYSQYLAFSGVDF